MLTKSGEKRSLFSHQLNWSFNRDLLAASLQNPITSTYISDSIDNMSDLYAGNDEESAELKKLNTEVVCSSLILLCLDRDNRQIHHVATLSYSITPNC